VTADSACYNAVEDQVSARGRVNLWRFGDRYKGDALQMNLDSGRAGSCIRSTGWN
jgi:LPS-assembly protein